MAVAVRGIVGMRERAALYSGELSAGRKADGGFEVSLTLPLDPVDLDELDPHHEHDGRHDPHGLHDSHEPYESYEPFTSHESRDSHDSHDSHGDPLAETRPSRAASA